MTPRASAHWPGLFTDDRLHLVEAANAERLALDGVLLGLADCGAVCTPQSAHANRNVPLCARCFPATTR